MDMKNKKSVKYYTYELDMIFLNILSLVVFGGVWLLVVLLSKDSSYLWSSRHVEFLLILMVLWMIFHEILHGIGFSLFPEVDKKNIVFGMALEKGVFYCMCKQKISKRVILTSLLFPFTFIGIVTLIWGMWIQSYYLVMLSILNIAGAVGDLVMTVYFLKCPNDIVYLDLDDSTSFTVLSDKDLSHLRVWGVKLKSSGIYDDSMVACDKRKVVISKTSYIILGIILVLSIIMIFI